MKKIIVFLFLITLGYSVQAQNKKWTLQECVTYALDNNISIKQSELDIESADADKLQAIGNMMPSLNANSSVSQNTGLNFNPITNNASTTTFLSVTGRINVGYTIFDGLRNIRQVQRADLNKLASQYRLDKMKDDISLFVANAYLQVLNNKANLKVLITQNEVTQQQIQQTQELVDGGVLPQGDLLEIKAQDATEKQNIALSENNVQVSLISLAQLLLIKEYESFDILDEGYEIIDEGISSKNISEILNGAKENRSEIKIAEKNFVLAE